MHRDRATATTPQAPYPVRPRAILRWGVLAKRQRALVTEQRLEQGNAVFLCRPSIILRRVRGGLIVRGGWGGRPTREGFIHHRLHRRFIER